MSKLGDRVVLEAHRIMMTSESAPAYVRDLRDYFTGQRDVLEEKIIPLFRERQNDIVKAAVITENGEQLSDADRNLKWGLLYSGVGIFLPPGLGSVACFALVVYYMHRAGKIFSELYPQARNTHEMLSCYSGSVAHFISRNRESLEASVREYSARQRT